MKRDPLTIMEQMFRALERGRPFTLNELSHETGIHSLTLKRYIRLVEMVREEPRIEIIRTRHSVVVRVLRLRKEGGGAGREAGDEKDG